MGAWGSEANSFSPSDSLRLVWSGPVVSLARRTRITPVHINFWPSGDQAFHLENIRIAELAGDSLGISDESQLLGLQALV